MPGTYSDEGPTEKVDSTICLPRTLSVSVSVLYINTMNQRVHVCKCACVRVCVCVCVTFKKLYYVSLENPAYSRVTISAYSDVWRNVFFLTAYYLKICIALVKIENNANLSGRVSVHQMWWKFNSKLYCFTLGGGGCCFFFSLLFFLGWKLTAF